MAESSKPVGRQLLTNMHLESQSSSDEEETPQFHKGILKQIEKMEKTLKKIEKRKQVGKRKIPNRSVVRRKRMNLITRNGLRNNVKKSKN